MPQFRFQAANEAGHIESGMVAAATKNSAAADLRARGLTPIVVDEAHEGGPFSRLANLAADTWLRRDPLDDQVTLFRHLASLLAAGIRAERALILIPQMSQNPRIRAAAKHWETELRAGRALSAAMARSPDLASHSIVQAVAAAEASGALTMTVSRIATWLAASQRLRNRVVSALAYPMLVSLTMMGVLGLIFSTVIPNLKPLFLQAGAEMPWPTAILVAMSDFSESYGLLALVLLVSAVIGSLIYARGANGRARLSQFVWETRLFAGLPVRVAASRFARELATMLSGGVQLARALEFVAGPATNAQLRRQLQSALQKVKQGQGLRASLMPAGRLPPLLIEMAGAGDETGNHADAMMRAADILDTEIELTLDRATAMLLPVMTLILGLIVALIMAGVVTGILAANDLAL